MRFFLLLMIVLSIASPFGFSDITGRGTNVPTLTIGGRVFTDLTNLIELVGIAGNTNGTTLRKPNATSGYTVTAGKTLTIYAVRVVVSSASAGVEIGLGYADNDVGQNTATSFTNPVSLGGVGNLMTLSTVGIFELAPFFQAPSTKFPYVQGLSGSGRFLVEAYGYEN